MTTEWTVLISAVCALMGAALGVAAYRRNSSRDVADGARANGVVLTEIGYMKSSADMLRQKLERQEEQFRKLSIELAQLQAAKNQACKRLERLEEEFHSE